MREAIYNSHVGDDKYGEDPTINNLEKMAADTLGKESALFVTSGTQGNLLAVLSQTERGDEVILPDDSHMILSESGGLASIANVQTRTLQNDKGQFDTNDLIKRIRAGTDLYKSKTGLICIENTHANSGGSILPTSYLKDVYKISTERNIPLHMDGSRIFNASVGLEIDIQEISQYADTIQFCLSKGLGAPMGSILAGPKDVIQKARHWRRVLGGATRQAGIVGAAGIIALEKMVSGLSNDHDLAKALGKGFNQLKNYDVVNENVESNIILLSIKNTESKMKVILNELKVQGILVNALDEQTIRFVTHHELTMGDVSRTIEIIKNLD